MKRALCVLAVMVAATVSSHAQSLDDLNIQIHGYATQGFLYSPTNNFNSAASSDGSAAWTEAVLNISALPTPKLRVAVQGRYYLLGNYGNSITVDFASADYKFSDLFGVRFGKVKTPDGLFNEIQDIDPAFLWSLLPQGTYPIASRTTFLSNYGGVAYGTVALAPRFGKIEYRAYAGERTVPSTDGLFVPLNTQGLYFPNGVAGPNLGGTLRWKTPLPGLTLGTAIDREHPSGAVNVPAAGLSGRLSANPFAIPFFFGQYERKRFMFAGEYSRAATKDNLSFPGLPPTAVFEDERDWYAMTSYKVTGKLNAGASYSYLLDHKAALGPSRFSKDWVVSARYDFNEFLYAKAEEHFIDGTAVGFLSTDNANLQPKTKLTILKVGVSF